MPDISLCPGGSCPRKETCYRHKAPPDKYMQSSFVEAPVEEDGSCRYYWPTREEVARIKALEGKGRKKKKDRTNNPEEVE